METLSSQFCSTTCDSNDNHLDEDEDDTAIFEREPTPPSHEKRLVKENVWKQFVEVNKRGHPHGKITIYLIEDVKAFAKGLNPCFGWVDRPLYKKQCFFN